MPGTFSKIFIHLIFAVKGRQGLIHKSWEEELFKYITGIIRNNNQKLLAINGVPDHIHFLLGMKPSCCLSDLIREIKKSSSDFINEKKFTRGKFHWQEGYGAFSSNQSSLDSVVNYILNQKQHHRKKTFREEYIEFLDRYEVEYKEEYLFDWFEIPIE